MNYQVQTDWGKFYPIKASDSMVSLKTVSPILVNRVELEGQIYLELGKEGWKVKKVALVRKGNRGPASQSAIDTVSKWAEWFTPLWVEPDRVKEVSSQLRAKLPELCRKYLDLKAELAKAEAELNQSREMANYLEYHWPKIDRTAPPHREH